MDLALEVMDLALEVMDLALEVMALALEVMDLANLQLNPQREDTLTTPEDLQFLNAIVIKHHQNGSNAKNRPRVHAMIHGLTNFVSQNPKLKNWSETRVRVWVMARNTRARFHAISIVSIAMMVSPLTFVEIPDVDQR